jgi:hypothetical protein
VALALCGERPRAAVASSSTIIPARSRHECHLDPLLGA